MKSLDSLPSAEATFEQVQKYCLKRCLCLLPLETYEMLIVGYNNADKLMRCIPNEEILSKTAVANAPTVEPEPKWIPIAERLPNPYQQCWFTTIDGDVEQHHFDGLVSRYKAWMPFEKPEPWKGEEDESN